MSFPYSPISPELPNLMESGRTLPPINSLPELHTSDRPQTPPKTPAESKVSSHKRRRSQSVGAEDPSFHKVAKVPRIDLGAPQMPPQQREPVEGPMTTQVPPTTTSPHHFFERTGSYERAHPIRLPSEILQHRRPEWQAPSESYRRPASPRLRGPGPLQRTPVEGPRSFTPLEGDPSRTLPPLESSRRPQGSQPSTLPVDIPRSDHRMTLRSLDEARPRDRVVSTSHSAHSSFSAPVPVPRRESGDERESRHDRISYPLITQPLDTHRERAVDVQWSPIDSAPEDSRPYPPPGIDYRQHESQRLGRGVEERPSEPRGRSLPPSTSYGQYQWEAPGAQADQMHRRRRGNLPKEATAALNDWFTRHYGYPYPKEEEKQQLQAQTGLSMSQISNWFINARRRRRPGILSRRPDVAGMAGPSP